MIPTLAYRRSLHPLLPQPNKCWWIKEEGLGDGMWLVRNARCHLPGHKETNTRVVEVETAVNLSISWLTKRYRNLPSFT